MNEDKKILILVLILAVLPILLLPFLKFTGFFYYEYVHTGAVNLTTGTDNYYAYNLTTFYAVLNGTGSDVANCTLGINQTLDFIMPQYNMSGTGITRTYSLFINTSGLYYYNITCQFPTVNMTNNRSFEILPNVNISSIAYPSVILSGLNFTVNVTYIDAANGSAISDANCSINFSSAQNMTFVGGKFQYTTQFSSGGLKPFNVTCTRENYSAVVNMTSLNVTDFFTLSQDLPGYLFNSLALGDYNQDGYNDIFIMGMDLSSDYYFDIYRNDISTFTEVTTNITGKNIGSIALLDLNNDGKLDLFVTGDNNTKGTELFNNIGGSFSISPISFRKVVDSSSAILDFNRDGKIDLLYQGRNESEKSDLLFYQNNISNLSRSTLNNSLIGKYYGSITYCLDEDNERIISTGWSESLSQRLSQLFIKNGTRFISGGNLPFGLERSSTICFDIDNNNVLDLITTGTTNGASSGAATSIYNGTINNFTFVRNLSKSYYSSSVSGDINNDGISDVILSGNDETDNPRTVVYLQNESNYSFQTLNINLVNLSYSSAVLYDIDLDNDLDLVFIGFDNVQPRLIIYKSNYNLIKNNTPPEPPTDITTSYSSGIFNVTWDKGNDTDQGQDGLYYNLRIGTSSTSNNIVSGKYGGSSNPTAGYTGNMQQRRHMYLNASEKTYYVSVQSIDAGLRSGDWYSVKYTPSSCIPLQDSDWNILNTFCDNATEVNGSIILTNSELNLTNANLIINNPGSAYIDASAGGLALLQSDITANIQTDLNASNLFCNSSTMSNIILNLNDTVYFRDCLSADINLFNNNNLNDSLSSQIGIFGSNNILTNVSGAVTSSATGSAVVRYYLTAYDNMSSSTLSLEVYRNSTLVSTYDLSSNHKVALDSYNHSGLTFNNLSNYSIRLVSGLYVSNLTEVNMNTNQQRNLTLFASTPYYAGLDNSTDFDNLSLENLSSVYAKIGKSNIGLIEFNEPVDVRGLNLTALSSISIGQISLSSLDGVANLTMFGLNYNYTPYILHDGINCSDCSIIEFGNTYIRFNVSGFSNYSLVPNTQLSISYSIGKITPNTTFEVRINYSDYITGQIISSANCSIFTPVYNSTSLNGVFIQNLSYSSIGSYQLQVNCTSSTYENITRNYTVTVQNPGPVFTLNQTLVGQYKSQVIADSTENPSYIILAGAANQTKVYTNNAGVLTLSQTDLNPSSDSSSAFADMDLDGNLDLLIANSGSMSRYELSAGSFAIKTDFDLSAVTSTLRAMSSIAVFDYNNDGKQDLVLCTSDDRSVLVNSINRTRAFKNTGSALIEDTSQNLTDVRDCKLAYLDYDKDGDYDLIILGYSILGPSSILYQNINGTLNASGISIPGVYDPILVIADFDENSYTDILFTGANYSNWTSAIINNVYSHYLSNFDGLLFINESVTNSVLPSVRGNAGYGAYDNNLMNIFIAARMNGSDTPNTRSSFYHNEQIFENDPQPEVINLSWGTSIFFDLDYDGDIDIITSGFNSTDIAHGHSYLYTSDASLLTPNTDPLAPSSLSASKNGTQVFINWSAGSDNETPTLGLYYNLRVGSSENKNEFMSGLMAISSNPLQGILGNVQQMRNITLNLSTGDRCINISIQTIDTGLRLSNWSEPFYIPTTEIADDGIDNDCDGISLTTSSSSSGGGGGGGGSPTAAIVQDDTPAPVSSGSPVISIPTPTKPQISGDSPSLPVLETPSEVKLDDLIFTSMDLRVSVQGQIDGSSTIITNTITNKGIFDRNFILKNKIPKDFVATADMIDPLGEDFQIIQYDPEIGYNLSLDQYAKTYIKYKVPIILDEVSLSKIQAIVDENKDELENQKLAFKEKLEETSKFVDITESYTQDYQNNKTTFTINIDVNQTRGQLYNVSIFQEIPKCLVNIINEQMIEAENKNFEIINADPLIVWHFDSILDVEKIQFTIAAIGDENCTNQVKALAVAKDIILYKKGKDDINYLNLWLALSIVPLLALFLIIFGYLTNKIEHDDEEVHQMTEYIKHHYRQGYNKEEVRKRLVYQGHPMVLVDRCLDLHTSSRFHFFLHKFEIGFEELILGILIVFNIMEFTDRLSGDLNYLQKVMSILVMAFLIYKVSPTKILLGVRNKIVDCLLIITFTALTMKSMVNLAHTNIWRADFVLDLYTYIIFHNQIFESYILLGGITLLLLLSLYLALTVPIKAPSFLNALHAKEGKPSSFFGYAWRFISIHFTLIAFYVIIFSLMMEWLAVVIDSFITTMILIIMVFLLIKHWKRLTFGLFSKSKEDDFTIAKWLESTSSASEKFYENFIDLFHYKKTIFLGISGMLILHIITELGNFVVPYLIGLRVSGEDLYFAYLDRLPLFSLVGKSLFALQTDGLNYIAKFQVATIYSLNIIAAIFIIIIPALIWLNFYKNRKLPILEVLKFKLTNYHLLNSLLFSLFASSMFILFTRPVFSLKPIYAGLSATGLHELNLSGVDLVTKIISLDGLGVILAIAASIAIIAFILSYFFEKIINVIALPISLGFFSYYVYLFTTSILFTDASSNLTVLIEKGSYMIAVYYGLFTLISIVFLYALGLMIVAYLYLHPRLKALLHDVPILRVLFLSHNVHHIHHYDTHDNLKHDTEERAMKEYILKSIDSGHELFHVVEYLVEHRWPIQLIEEAVHDATNDPRYKEEMKHIKHFHHNKEKLQALGIWIKEMYQNHSLDQIIDAASSAKWTEDDIVLAFTSVKTQLHLRKEDYEIAKYMYINN